MQQTNEIEINMTIYKDRVICFVDILGWTNLTQDSVSNESLLRSIDSAVSAMAEISEFCPQVNETYQEIFGKDASLKGIMKAKTDLISTHFSDTVVLSASPEKESVSALVSVVIGLSIVLLKAGYYVRGAITRGLLHHTQNSLYGPALIAAYEMEKCNSIYPRIILTENILDFLPDKEWARLDDGDDLHFLNILKHVNASDILAIENLLEANILKAIGNLAITQKLNWMRNYLRSHKESNNGRGVV